MFDYTAPPLICESFTFENLFEFNWKRICWFDCDCATPLTMLELACFWILLGGIAWALELWAVALVLIPCIWKIYWDWLASCCKLMSSFEAAGSCSSADAPPTFYRWLKGFKVFVLWSVMLGWPFARMVNPPGVVKPIPWFGCINIILPLCVGTSCGCCWKMVNVCCCMLDAALAKPFMFLILLLLSFTVFGGFMRWWP